MLHFVYRDALVEDELVASSSSSCPSVDDSLTAKLLAAADRYDLGRLKRMCESHLCKEISVNSVSKTLALADRYHAAELKAVCLRFAAENLAGAVVILIFLALPFLFGVVWIKSTDEVFLNDTLFPLYVVIFSLGVMSSWISLSCFLYPLFLKVVFDACLCQHACLVQCLIEMKLLLLFVF